MMPLRWLFFWLMVIMPLRVGAAEAAVFSGDDRVTALAGKRVVVEGLTWGKFEKGLGERLLLPSGTNIYLAGPTLREKFKDGRTMRATGRLKIETMEPAPPGAQGYTVRFQYYALEVETLEAIEAVTLPYPELPQK